MQRHYHVAFRDLCTEVGKEPTSEYRHQVSEMILGYQKSSSQWTGKEYSIVIDQLKEWRKGGTTPHQLDQATRNQRDFDQRKNQLIYAIENAGAPEAYIQAIATDKFGTRPWREHGTVQLQRLRYTINARMQKKASAQRSAAPTS